MLRRLMALVLVAASLSTVRAVATAAPALADEQRPWRSYNSGLVAPEIATDIIAANLIIAPEPGEESFTPVTLVGVQMVPMTKILRDGSIDPDHALAFWLFTVAYPRNGNYWPPQAGPPPTAPWRWHFYEMPDGAFTGIGLSQGSPMYTPSYIPGDWKRRFVDAARTRIPQATWDAAVNVDVADVDNTGAMQDAPPGVEAACPEAFGLDNEEPCEGEGMIGEVFANADQAQQGQPGQPAPPAPPGQPAPPAQPVPPGPVVPPAPVPAPGGSPIGHVVRLCTDTFLQSEACLAAVAIGGGIIARVLEKRKVGKKLSVIPCFGQTAEVLSWMAVAEGLLIAAAFKPSSQAVGVFSALAAVAFGWGFYQMILQMRTCYQLMRAAYYTPPIAPAVIAAAVAAMAVSAVAIVGVGYTAARNIDSTREWWGGQH